MIKATLIEKILEISTAPAAMSLRILISGLISFVIKSASFSMEEFTASVVKTNAEQIKIVIHSNFDKPIKKEAANNNTNSKR